MELCQTAAIWRKHSDLSGCELNALFQRREIRSSIGFRHANAIDGPHDGIACGNPVHCQSFGGRNVDHYMDGLCGTRFPAFMRSSPAFLLFSTHRESASWEMARYMCISK
jgi:hypothetical protein